MALTNLSQITTSGISTLADINLNNLTGVAATFTGNVTVGGTLTYDDVTNIDSVGLITARSGVSITGGQLTLPDSIVHAGNDNAKIRFPAADTITAETGGSERVRITSGGNIGINNSNPLYLVHLKSNSTASSKRVDIHMTNDTTGHNATDGVQFGYQDVNGAYIWNFENTPIYFATNNTERLRIDSSGRSLFRTNGSQTTPVADVNVPLQIAESTGGMCYIGVNKGNSYGSLIGHHTAFGGTVIRNLTSDNIVFYTNNTQEKLRITSAGDLCLGSGVGANNDGSGISIYNSSFPRISFRNSTTGNTVADGSQLYLVSDDLYVTNNENADVIFRTNATDRLRITSSGNVGINQGSPSEKLEIYAGDILLSSNANGVSGGVGPNAALKFEYNGHQYAKIVGNGRDSSGYGDIDFYTSNSAGVSNLTQRMTIRADGKVGIGTDNPGVAGIDILANSAAIRCRESGGADARLVSGGSISYFGTYSNHDLQVLTNGSNALRVDSSQRLLLGTTSAFGGGSVGELLQVGYSGGSRVIFGNTSTSLSNGTLIGQIDFNTKVGGTVSTGAAIKVNCDGSAASGDAPSRLTFHTTADGAASPTERLRITPDGNVTIGGKSNPDWNSTVDALTVGYAGVLYEDSYSSGTDNYVILGNNVYYPGGGNKYIRNDEASRIMMHSGTFYFQNAGAGTAGNSITFADRLRITSSGYLFVPTDGAGSYGGGTFAVFSGSSSGRLDLYGGATNHGGEIQLYGGSNSDGIIVFRTGAGSGQQSEKLRIDSSGCVRVGNTHSQTTSSNTKRIALGAKASIWGWTSGNINGALTLADNYYWDGANNRAIEADEAAYLTLRSGSLRFGTTNSTPSAGGVTGLTEKFRITSDGRVVVNWTNPDSFNIGAKLIVKQTGADIANGTADNDNGGGSSNTRGIHLYQDSNDDKSIGLWFTTGGHLSGISGQRSNYSSHWGTDLRFYTHSANTSNVTQSFERLRITDNGHFQIGGGSSFNYLKNEYRGSVSVTGTNNESFAFEIQGASYGSGGLLYMYGTSGNVVVNASAEILVNHSNDVTIKSMSGAYTQLRIRVKTDTNARAAIYLGRSAGHASGTTSINWRFIPYGGTYAYSTESTNNGTDYTHITQSGSFRISAAGGGAGNVNASGSKNFMIDHPLESLRETTRLAHAAVEGPECNTIYRGKVDLVDGTATVNIDTNSRMTEGTFVALNQNVQCFTTNETGWTAIKGSVSGNLLTIIAQDNTCTDTISWMVVGERHDQDIIDNRSTDSDGRFIPETTD